LLKGEALPKAKGRRRAKKKRKRIIRRFKN